MGQISFKHHDPANDIGTGTENGNTRAHIGCALPSCSLLFLSNEEVLDTLRNLCGPFTTNQPMHKSPKVMTYGVVGLGMLWNLAGKSTGRPGCQVITVSHDNIVGLVSNDDSYLPLDRL